MTSPDKIFLLGFMGSGKTTLGKKLAAKLQYPFLDLDAEIEKQAELSIDEVFEKQGEDHFRILEKETLTQIITNHERFVLSVGGGTPCFYDNMDVICKAGTSIYLKYNAGMLASRLINAKTQRPLIKGLNEEELNSFIAEKLSEREEYYNKSNVIAEGNNLKVDDLIRLIQ